MSRPGPRRPSVTVRMHPDLLARIDVWAYEQDLVKGSGEANRSEAINQLAEWALNQQENIKLLREEGEKR